MPVRAFLEDVGVRVLAFVCGVALAIILAYAMGMFDPRPNRGPPTPAAVPKAVPRRS